MIGFLKSELERSDAEHEQSRASQAIELREQTITSRPDDDARDQLIAELQATYSRMQATRVWRLGSTYWQMRDRVKQLLGRGTSEH